ncbi:uncharacterized protein L3040_007503 [Drepanopeziza brunnea f. sp. 'multigermtubi']|uniref:Uncharacterized protein n=1 Tax=Marssonina brunnea f. sp. multigermtubi (strain MB_m1) TaxID=1072389 RepID=K1XCI2_MARBU|nr:uncharacterized protein MBM_03466 [Drepanopeziza brunnea f. sp. 'multigermtubi' MB_m1]EKD18473.1 hypothetical protein MBM_03466 [Drepanopeziza brunnea f. sp. 'multigermtubi' MB_m1]KAJ5037327.1 hypothetical protein L3040_007503 [Drepanopeziza brunnea f. sp. 'multigermtubi']
MRHINLNLNLNLHTHLFITILHLPFSAPHILLTTPTSIPTRTVTIRQATVPEPTPPPAQQLAQNSSCALLSQVLSICVGLTPGFVTLTPAAQAHCLCYSSTVWVPKVLDDAVKTCADFASTAAPAAFGPLVNLEGFCESVGDVGRGIPASGAVATTTASVGGDGNGNPSYRNGGGGGSTASAYVPPAAAMPSYEGGNANGGGQIGEGSAAGTSSSGSGSGIGGSGAGNSNGGGSRSFTLSDRSGSSTSQGMSSMTRSSTSQGVSSMTSQSTSTGTRIPTITGISMTVNDAGTTRTGDGAVRNRGEVTEGTVVLVSMAIAMLLIFL